ncbi:hypothetical protein V7S43_010496 [Phytophthora oleae]|uniref:Dynein heavy chain hydrolytic ATP-binding dynein motor region domain-containing protein n=1 Tax=Phytophthora oleae TaxID=2107226 RepID=A0ABD3FGT6_9STRA
MPQSRASVAPRSHLRTPSTNPSRKMCKLYILCSEQLSQQPHYDYGLRAVKSVLVMAGSLKRANPDLNEDVTLIRALRDSNIPKFLADDLPLFHAIHAANGSLLDDAHGRVRHEARRGPRGSRGNGKDREQQGPGQGHGHPVRRVQLQRPDRLQDDGEALPQAGNWTCLDEFNRFDIEVLSVVAQQLLILREGLIQGKEHINFMGIKILLKDHHSS